MNKPFSLITAITILLILSGGIYCHAQMKDSCVFLKGTYIEVGIAPNGSFGTPVNAPPGYHARPVPVNTGMYNPVDGTYKYRDSALGFVADYGKDGWDVGSPGYFGDYFMPGTEQEGFSIQINDKKSTAYSYNYTINRASGFTGSLTGKNISLTTEGSSLISVWEGTANKTLAVRQTVKMNTDKSYFVINVFLKNNDTGTLKDIYYMRTVDPDNEVSLSGSFVTQNVIQFQLPNAYSKTLVTATGLSYKNAYLGLGTKDCQAKAFVVRSDLIPDGKLDDIYNETTSYIYKDSFMNDVGIGVVFKIGDMAPGDSTSFAYAYILNEDDLDDAFNETVPGIFYNGRYYPSGSVIVQPEGTVIPLETVNGDGYSWTWSPSVHIDTSQGASVNAIVSDTATTYTVSGTGTGVNAGRCANNIISITVSPYPVSPPPVVLSPVEYCMNDSAVPLFATGPGILKWYTTSAGGTYSTSAPVPSTKEPGTFTWYVTQELEGIESRRVPVTVIIHPLPQIILSPAAGEICTGDTLEIFVTGTEAQYTWAFSPGIIKNTGDTLIVAPRSDISYFISAIDSNGCENISAVDVTVNPLPVITINPLSPSFCPEGSVEISADAAGAVSFEWSPAEGLDNTTASTVIASPSATTTYTVNIIDDNSCKNSRSVSVTINPLPQPDLGADRNICFSDSIILSPGSFALYKWQDGTGTPYYTIRIPGLYFVDVTNSYGCIASDTMILTRTDTLPVSFLPDDAVICKGSAYTLSIQGYKNYLWSNGETGYTATLKGLGTYTLKVQDFNGCYGTDSMHLLDAHCIPFELPNAFTPNGDGLNDTFGPYLTQIVSGYKMTVWDRWGYVVFESSNPSVKWNGRTGSVEQNSGTYIYRVLFNDSDGKPLSLQGTVVLIR